MRIVWELDASPNEAGIAAMVRALAFHNLQWLFTVNNVPKLYESGVSYCYRPNDPWRDFPTLLRLKSGDCEDLVAARLAEYWLAGIEADVFVEWQPSQNNYHITIQVGGRIEDPSAILNARQQWI